MNSKEEFLENLSRADVSGLTTLYAQLESAWKENNTEKLNETLNEKYLELRKLQEKIEQELASLEKYHREEAVKKASGRFPNFEREKAEIEEEERRFEIEERELEQRYFKTREELREQLREINNFAEVKESIERETEELNRRIEEVIRDREGIEDRVLKGFEIENREDSSELSKRIRVILEARRVVSDFAIAKRENEKYTRAYEFFRKGTWEKR